MPRILAAPLKTFLAGLLASLPLILTFLLLGWVAGLLKQFLGPESLPGRMLAAIGLHMVADEWTAYLLGALVLAGMIFLLGLVVQTSLRVHVEALIDRSVRRLPVIGPLYEVTDRFVGMFDRKQQADLSAMSPVWCFFGGERGTGVLALMPNPQPILFGDKAYHAVLVPTAPIPVGGGLLYVPAEWVKPAEIGVEQLTSIYLSMGLHQPPSRPASPAA
ncbi:MAG: hypothetical protein CGU29_03990 [Candidatus Dactylopiibacterium carminicum]|uniref:DUF502 domain-containing protein n=1 Tax=Candidatus Dactylopiibacterium carminicum TaxID=857335 RepID=A0A272EWL2_9RHOO|nr:DUF502 domain-containing protein [Candidatus Dactylopiibacterium carminicum]PAS94507.1 MAG: hypothetical protein CGU29_03990 [Candidatus Dactylopiibacterium carminicum]PAT00001.1 MAG: hypothetical protein BSR46_04985 [Candidatus Dactylopiibacterium carminicum]